MPMGDPPTAERVLLDTSVLIADPESLFGFPNADVIIPLTVIEELDGHKSRLDDVGRSARQALRHIESLRVAAGGSLKEPVDLPGGGTLRIETNGLLLDKVAEMGFSPEKADNRILAAALGQNRNEDTTVTLVTNDAALRIKASQIGLRAAEHIHRVRTDDPTNPGWSTLDVSAKDIDLLYEQKKVDADEVGIDENDLSPNQFYVMRHGSQSAMVRCHARDTRLSPTIELVPERLEAWGLHSRSKEQQFALDLLLDPDVSVVALDGSAGTGKTLVAIAAGLEQTVEQKQYERLCVYRPIIPVGKADLGFLPGGMAEKLDPWMSAIHDAVVALTESGSYSAAATVVEELVANGKMVMESVTYLRGRTLHRSFVVVDEAQNLEPATLKTILTRMGEDTKIVFTGDTSQIDAPYLSEYTNALAVLVDAFAGEPCFGHMRLTSCERSHVAALAASKL